MIYYLVIIRFKYNLLPLIITIKYNKDIHTYNDNN